MHHGLEVCGSSSSSSHQAISVWLFLDNAAHVVLTGVPVIWSLAGVLTAAATSVFSNWQFALGREGAAALQEASHTRTKAAAAAFKQNSAAPVKEQMIDQVKFVSSFAAGHSRLCPMACISR
jgi:hypothetical protein